MKYLLIAWILAVPVATKDHDAVLRRFCRKSDREWHELVGPKYKKHEVYMACLQNEENQPEEFEVDSENQQSDMETLKELSEKSEVETRFQSGGILEFLPITHNSATRIEEPKTVLEKVTTTVISSSPPSTTDAPGKVSSSEEPIQSMDIKRSLSGKSTIPPLPNAKDKRVLALTGVEQSRHLYQLSAQYYELEGALESVEKLLKRKRKVKRKSLLSPFDFVNKRKGHRYDQRSAAVKKTNFDHKKLPNKGFPAMTSLPEITTTSTVKPLLSTTSAQNITESTSHAIIFTSTTTGPLKKSAFSTDIIPRKKSAKNKKRTVKRINRGGMQKSTRKLKRKGIGRKKLQKNQLRRKNKVAKRKLDHRKQQKGGKKMLNEEPSTISSLTERTSITAKPLLTIAISNKGFPAMTSLPEVTTTSTAKPLVTTTSAQNITESTSHAIILTSTTTAPLKKSALPTDKRAGKKSGTNKKIKEKRTSRRGIQKSTRTLKKAGTGGKKGHKNRMSKLTKKKMQRRLQRKRAKKILDKKRKEQEETDKRERTVKPRIGKTPKENQGKRIVPKKKNQKNRGLKLHRKVGLKKNKSNNRRSYRKRADKRCSCK